MIKKSVVAILSIVLISGCWNSLEIDEVLMVLGAGIDKTENGYLMSVEYLQTSGGPAADQAQNQGKIISMEGETIQDSVRSMIRKSKRRMFFTHTKVWIFSERLARHNLVQAMYAMRRNQMPRLNSFLLITPEQPKDILSATTVSEDLTSVEMAASLEATRFTSQFEPMEMKTAFKMLSGPIPTCYIPIIQTSKDDEQIVTEVVGSAIIKNEKMVGKLNVLETKGLLYLRGDASGGSITAEINDGQTISLEVQNEAVSIVPHLNGEKLSVNIDIDVEGTLADTPTEMEVNEQTIHQMEQLLSQDLKHMTALTLTKLQKDLKTDVVDIGLHVYRDYPQQWHSIKNDWDDIFANAEIHVNVHISIFHKGLINQSRGGIYNKPQFIPFYFSDDKS